MKRPHRHQCQPTWPCHPHTVNAGWINRISFHNAGIVRGRGRRGSIWINCGRLECQRIIKPTHQHQIDWMNIPIQFNIKSNFPDESDKSISTLIISVYTFGDDLNYIYWHHSINIIIIRSLNIMLSYVVLNTFVCLFFLFLLILRFSSGEKVQLEWQWQRLWRYCVHGIETNTFANATGMDMRRQLLVRTRAGKRKMKNREMT